MSMTLHQIKIFWAVAQAQSYTKASKTLGLAQPSLSQQITKLEEELGIKLFNRGHSKVSLTDAGEFLFNKSEQIIAGVEEATSGMQEFSEKKRGVINIGMLTSVARNILPSAMKKMHINSPNIDINVLEVSPREALDLLYARQLSIAVVAADSIATANLSFAQQDVFTDPYALAVPKGLNLEGIESLQQLSSKDRKTLSSNIVFEFGSQHKKRIEEWLKTTILTTKTVAHTRSYEVALSMVEAGLGVAVIPALTASIGLGKSYGVTLYKTNLPERRLVTLIPAQYNRLEPYSFFIKCLVEAGKEVISPKINITPPILETLIVK